ncbi:MAG: SCO family protein [Lutibacter sp.]|jgi:protein SCO1/2|nr:SCO family protein [Lutibacter sp.]
MDLKFFKKSLPTLAIMAVFSVLMIYAIYSLLTPEKRLPVYNPADVNPRLVDDGLRHIRSNHRVGDFSLINQRGDTITHQDYQHSIYVVDFFFTRCTTICPLMTSNMTTLQAAFLNDEDVKLLSHSVTPVIDSVPVLKAYAEQMGVIDAKWNLVTGPKKHIYDLARKHYFAVLDEGDGGLQDFIHTENFVLVDPKRQIRGFYDGTDPEEIARLIQDIRLLQSQFRNN